MSDVYIQDTERLPLSYNHTRVVLLAKDPHWLFAYWELSREKRDQIHQELGHDLWEKTIPVLKITNVSRNSSFIVRINDFSDNWYINVDDPGSMYVAEIGRKLSDRYFINFASSNYISTPNETASRNASAYFINYKNMKHSSLDMETGNIYQSYDLIVESVSMLGLSSPELLVSNTQVTGYGVSSAASSGIPPEGLQGVNTESFLK